MRSTQTIAEVQPRDILTASELTKVRDLLRDADMLVTDVKAILSDRGMSRRLTGSRILRVAVREMLAMERLIEASTPGLFH